MWLFCLSICRYHIQVNPNFMRNRLQKSCIAWLKEQIILPYSSYHIQVNSNFVRKNIGLRVNVLFMVYLTHNSFVFFFLSWVEKPMGVLPFVSFASFYFIFLFFVSLLPPPPLAAASPAFEIRGLTCRVYCARISLSLSPPLFFIILGSFNVLKM